MNYLALMTITFGISLASELPAWHMKPLGSHIKPETVDETFADNIISPEEFADKYVLPQKPVVFRNIVKEWPAYRLWDDDYLKENYGSLELRIEAKKEKEGGIPKGDVCLGRDTMRTFLNDYINGENKYAVSELPTPMWHEVNVPSPMACGEFLTNYVEIDLWMNSDTGKRGKGGYSILHKDQFNTVNCVLNGTKEWKLIELKYNDYVYQSWEGPMDANDGGFSLINPDKVDAKEFPDIGKIPRWQFVTINAGDCLYLPRQMWHQVKSFGVTNKAVAFLFSQFKNKSTISTTGCHSETEDVRLSDVDVDLKYPGHGIMTMGLPPLWYNQNILYGLVDEQTGLITAESTHKLVKKAHSLGEVHQKTINDKSDSLYKLMFKIAGEDERNMTNELVKGLTRDQIRSTLFLINEIEPSASCDRHEFAYFEPNEILSMIKLAAYKNKGKLEKKLFTEWYEKYGGTQPFAESLWKRLAGERLTVDIRSANIADAVRPYFENRRDQGTDKYDDDATMTTAEGHVSQPKKRKGGYGYVTDATEIDRDDSGIGDNEGGERSMSEELKEEL